MRGRHLADVVGAQLSRLALSATVLAGDRHLAGKALRGQRRYDAARHADFATVEGTVLLVAMFIVVVNLIVDIGFAWLDPRVTVT